MSRAATVRPLPPRALLVLLALAALAGWSLPPARSQTPAEPTPLKGANFKQAYKYSPEFLRQFVHTTAVTPTWIGKTDSFWYQYNTSKGKHWYRVDPRAASKEPLFDRVRLGALLSEQVRKPLDPSQLPIARLSLSDDGTKLKFVTDNLLFEYDLKAEKLDKLGKAPAVPFGAGGLNAEQLDKLRQQIGDEKFKEFLQQQQKLEQGDKKGGESSWEEEFADLDLYVQEALAQFDQEALAQQKKGGFGGKGGKGGLGGGPDVYAPDRKLYAYALNHDLYLAEEGKADEAVRLTKDSAVEYTFNAAVGFGAGIGTAVTDQKDKDKDKKTRPAVTWSKDSKAFYATRTDVRGLKELFLVNNVANPRPTLMRYTYPMPGDENVRKTELFVFHLGARKLIHVEPKWKDETYSDLHWGKSSDELRFVRHDRLHRNAEFCTVNVQTGEAKCLILEGFENANLVTQAVRYLDESDEMIWWSERGSWGHYFLYDRSGKLKNAITAGDFRAGSIVAVDAKHRVLYFRGNGRETGENVYFNHLYSIHFDGTGLTLLDPGDANHDSLLSPSRQYVIDNSSRFDQAPASVLRDARGNKVLELEKADLSKLHEVGWRLPEVFTVKAADGVTDLYGHLWKPFDFDPKKKYPIIAHVYPGPQTESMTHAFQPISPQQQLAQLNFIVIQVGNRGGTPLRSKAYQAHSYWDMRDYGLADKKTAIEQLASRFAWIDIDRVGIYGHSGGGFMSAAALLVKPYNDFFKVAVSSAGNHDNNIYNNTWAERYHGMKEVPVGKADAKDDGKKDPPKKGGKKGFGEQPEEDEQGQRNRRDVQGKDGMKDDKGKEATQFQIKVPTNPELATNLKGKLLLVHGDMDNNVHPAHTIRLADALIKANKRFDMLILPGKSHGFADYQPYFTQRMWEYFAEHLLDDRSSGADLYDRRDKGK
jgi:dipeptidyl aminopeptidase/acylaminoacyl peptidase